MALNCERIDELLSAWIEEDLDQATHDAVSEHLGECLRCAAIVRDITAIRRDAARLPELEPSRDLWDGIAARIEAPVITLDARRASPARRRWTLAAAAVLLVTVTSGITYTVAMNLDRTAGSVAASADAPIADPGTPASLVSADPRAPEIVYNLEIDQLRTILTDRREELDSATVAVVEQSLATIDKAIAEARAALARDTSDPFLHEQLNRALEKKLGLLRTVALLPAGAS